MKISHYTGILFALAFLFPAFTHAAIAFDAASTGHIDGNTGSLTVSHTCTGSNLILFVSVGVFDSAPSPVANITYNGVALTKVTSRIQSTSRTELWYLAGPSTGTHNIVVSFSDVNADSRKSLAAASYTGASQTGIPDASSNNGADSTASLTDTVTTVADNSWTIMGLFSEKSDVTAGTGTLVRANPGALTVSAWMLDSNGPKSPVGSKSLIANATAGIMSDVMVSFAPVSTPAPASFISLFITGDW